MKPVAPRPWLDPIPEAEQPDTDLTLRLMTWGFYAAWALLIGGALVAVWWAL